MTITGESYAALRLTSETTPIDACRYWLWRWREAHQQGDVGRMRWCLEGYRVAYATLPWWRRAWYWLGARIRGRATVPESVEVMVSTMPHP